MSREDSGVIDLFAIHARASERPAGNLAPPDLVSAPPPAFTSDVGGDADDDGFDPFARKPRKKLAIIAGAGGALLFIGILVASLSGGSDAPKATAASATDPGGGKTGSSTIAPPAAAPIPEPAAAAQPSAASAPAARATAAVHVPPPPTTGAVSSPKAPSRGRAVASKPRAASGPKLTKVQSGGT